MKCVSESLKEVVAEMAFQSMSKDDALKTIQTANPAEFKKVLQIIQKNPDVIKGLQSEASAKLAAALPPALMSLGAALFLLFGSALASEGGTDALLKMRPAEITQQTVQVVKTKGVDTLKQDIQKIQEEAKSKRHELGQPGSGGSMVQVGGKKYRTMNQPQHELMQQLVKIENEAKASGVDKSLQESLANAVDAIGAVSVK